jgi:bacterioferritin-associated ferredoxin
MKKTPEKRPCAKCGKKFEHLILEVTSYPCVSLCMECSEEARRVFNRWLNEPVQLEFDFEEAV